MTASVAALRIKWLSLTELFAEVVEEVIAL